MSTGADADAVTPTPEEDDPWIGRTIEGRYVIESQLASGGMGAVYAAKHAKLGNRVAVKLIHPEFADNDEVIERFGREVEANARLEDHRNIVAALDCGTMKSGEAYLVMELAEGESLTEVLARDGAMGWRRACQIGAQIADALVAAHTAGVVHRDLKPDNILLVPQRSGPPEAKILDFGIARFLDGSHELEGPALTKEGTVVGTVGYMAPEQALGQPVDARADLYALGVLLWEMVAGEGLFQRVTLTSFVTTQLADTPRPLTEVTTDGRVPPALSTLVGELLTSKQADRIADTKAVRDRLKALAAPRKGGDPKEMAREGLAKAREVLAPVLERGRELMERALALPPPKVMAVGAGLGALATTLLFLFFGLIIWAASGDDVEDVERAEASGQEGIDYQEDVPRGVVLSGNAAPNPDLEAMLSSDEWQTRRAAARRVLQHRPRSEVEPLALELARLEILSDCGARTRAVQEIAEIGDARAVPALQRYRQDRCGGDFRAEVGRAIGRLQ